MTPVDPVAHEKEDQGDFPGWTLDKDVGDLLRFGATKKRPVGSGH